MKTWLCDARTLIACILLLVLFVILGPWITQDGVNHQKVALILSRLAGSPLENDVYQSQLSLWHTNEIFPALYTLVHKHVSIEHYERIFVAFFMAAFIFSYWLFLKKWSPKSLCYWPLVLPLCFNPLLIRGFYNFLASLALTLLCLVLLKIKSHRVLSWFAFTLLAWLAFLAHPFPSFILVPSILLLMSNRDLKKSFRFFPFLLSAIFFFALGFLPSLLQSHRHETSLPLKFSPVWETFAGLFIWNVSAFHWIAFILFIPFFWLLMRLAWVSLREVGWGYKKYWLCFLALLFIFPLEANQGSFLNHRFLIFIWLFIPLGLEETAFNPAKGFWICFLTFLCCVLLTTLAMKQVQGRFLEAKKVYEKLPPGKRLYSINFEVTNYSSNMHPLMHLWAAYPNATAQFNPYLFAYSDLMPLSYKLKASSTYFPSTHESLPHTLASGYLCKQYGVSGTECDSLRIKSFEEILDAASFYEYCLLHQTPESFLQALNKKGVWEKVSESGSLSLWKNHQPQDFKPDPWSSIRP